MNEAEILARLDERGRRAARSLRRATVDVEPAPPDRVFARPPRRPVQRLLLAAAVILVLGVGIVTLVTRADDRGRDDGPPADDPVEEDGARLRLGADWLPGGFGAIAAWDGDADKVNTAFGPVVVWGGPDAMSSAGGPSMLATTYARTDPERELVMDNQVPGDPNLQVQGRQATFKSGLDPALEVERGTVLTADGTNVLQFELDGGRYAVIASRQLDRDALAAIAEAARLVDEELAFDPATLPAGWNALHEAAFGDLPGGWGGPGASVVRYHHVAGDRWVTVNVTRADRRRVDVLHAVAEDVQAVEVRGHEASTGRLRWTGTGLPFERDLQVVTWEEQPGAVVHLEGEQMGLDELLRIAEGLAPMTDEEFRATEPGMLQISDRTRPVAEGRIGDGRPWRLFAEVKSFSDLSPDESLNVQLEIDEGESSALGRFRPAIPMSEVGPGTAAIRVEAVPGSWAPMVFGVVPDEAVRVEARSSDGSVSAGGVYDLTDDRLGVDAVVVETPANASWVDVVALRGDGSEVAATRVEIPGA